MVSSFNSRMQVRVVGVEGRGLSDEGETTGYEPLGDNR